MIHATRISLTVLVIVLAACSGSDRPVEEPAEPAAEAEQPFFEKVRPDFFAGLRGDGEALDRAMQRCEEVLEDDPDHPEALVWHGSGLLVRAGAAFEAGDETEGLALWNRGLAEMDRAVELAPDHLGVRIPRGATLLATSRFTPEHVGRPLLEKGVRDYERAYELQADELDALSLHARGQLLYGLADGWDRLGDEERAERFYRALGDETGDSPYRARAEAWLSGEPLPPETAEDCGSCHAR